MTIIVDRTGEPDRHRFGKDKARFLNRIRDSVRKAVQNKVSDGSIKNFENGGVRVPIPKKTTQEPVIHHKKAPYIKKVFPGNLYDVGDVVPIPPGGGGGGGGGQGSGPEASDGEDSEDDFVWLSEEEFLDIFFEGRKLPDLSKLSEEGNPILERQRAGHTSKGPSHRMDMGKTNKKRRADELVLNKANERRLINELIERYNIYRSYCPDLPEINLKGKSKTTQTQELSEALNTLSAQFTMSAGTQSYKNKALNALFDCLQTLEENIDPEIISDPSDQKRLDVLRSRVSDRLKAKSASSKFQSAHRTYHFDDEKPKPVTKAVMICKMDVSGSMGEHEKNTAKAFFWVLNRFLKTNYEEVDIVFISHTTTAEEVDEQEFFYGNRSGGTLVSSCLEKELDIIKERYASGEWNIYSTQATDGDNITMDNDRVEDFMHKILPLVQASYFIEVQHQYRRGQGRDSDLHEVYKGLAQQYSHLKTASVGAPSEALDAFTKFFPANAAPEAQSAPAMMR